MCDGGGGGGGYLKSELRAGRINSAVIARTSRTGKCQQGKEGGNHKQGIEARFLASLRLNSECRLAEFVRKARYTRTVISAGYSSPM